MSVHTRLSARRGWVTVPSQARGGPLRFSRQMTENEKGRPLLCSLRYPGAAPRTGEWRPTTRERLPARLARLGEVADTAGVVAPDAAGHLGEVLLREFFLRRLGGQRQVDDLLGVL